VAREARHHLAASVDKAVWPPSANYSHLLWQAGHVTMHLSRSPRDLIDIKSSGAPFLL
jgi:hypothetical protein